MVKRNALAMAQKAQANVGKAVDYLVIEFERAVHE